MNFLNYLINDDFNNFKQSLKFNKKILIYNNILNSLPNNFKIINGFNYNSLDKKISKFEKISLKIDKNNFNKIDQTNLVKKYNCKFDYCESKNILNIIL